MIAMFRKAAVAVLALTASTALADTRLQGAGATFPDPLYQRMTAEYQKAHPDIKIDYKGIGSGGGIKAITAKTVDFCGSDAPLSKKQIATLGGEDKVIQVPSCAGGVVPAYNVPGAKGQLKFSGEVLAEIYMGKINNWSDPKLTSLNPDAALPNLAITPAWRTDGSGTNFVWTNYLCSQSQVFKENIGAATSVRWPFGVGGQGNPGVAAIVQQTPGAIGYLEQAFADNGHITYGVIQNKDGKFVKASPQSVSAAGGGAVDQMKGHVLAANIWNQAGDEAYPAASFTYLIIYKDLSANVKSKEDAQAVVDFLWWATHDGQKFAPELDYAPLAPGVVKKVEDALSQATWQGQPLKPSGK